MRPRELSDFVGQNHILAAGKPLRRMIESGELHSMILWGPPGSGKTTLALLIARHTKAYYVQFSAVLSGVAEIRKVVRDAEYERRVRSRATILFVDEIHRFNKAQQDAFLPHVETGLVTLIGATTENPSFEVIGPLLSRVRVYVLNQLSPSDLIGLMRRALVCDKRMRELCCELEEGVLEHIARISDGDARRALNTLELVARSVEPDAQGKRLVTTAILEQAAQRKFLLYDKSGDEHYNLISALHKSLRGSDPDAALYWLARMIEAGEDPLYLARRMVRFASEDVGNADPHALVLAVAAKEAVEFIGMPEGNTALAQVAIYLALAPKSNAVYVAYGAASRDALGTVAEPVPLHLRNAPTQLMEQLGFGQGYRYPHDYPDAQVAQDYFPNSLGKRKYYNPTDRGFEEELGRRLKTIRP
ncbi:MAG: replication-associated recombination protein A [candidate division WOR-3 bacterium]